VTPSDVEFLFRNRLGIRLGEDMSDYVLRRFQEGGAACAPVVPPAPSDEVPGTPVRRFGEAVGDEPAAVGDPVDPLVQ
jgi:hypothetical protein